MHRNKGLSPFQEITESPIMGGYVLKQKYNGVTFLEIYAKSPGLLLDKGISPVKADWGGVRSEYPYPHPEQAPYTFIEGLIAYCIDSAVYTYEPVRIYNVERCYKKHTRLAEKGTTGIERTLSLNGEEYTKYLSGEIKRDHRVRAFVQKIEIRNKVLDELLQNCAASLGLNKTIVKQLGWRYELLITLMNFYMVFVESMDAPHGRNTSERFRKVVKTLVSTDYLNAIRYLSERVEPKEKVKELIRNLEELPFLCFLPLYEGELERMSNMVSDDILLDYHRGALLRIL